MDNLLLHYLGKGLEGPSGQEAAGAKPLVTISREFGCPSKLIAIMLTDALNRRAGQNHLKKWKFISKEILEEAAKDLQLSPLDVKYMLSAGEKGLMEDFLVSFSSQYVSNSKVKHTLIRVVNTIAQMGYVVLVGRGSAAILHERPLTLHIRLQAPVEWRIASVCESRGISPAEAGRMIEHIDRKRSSLYELVLGKKFDPYIFDVVFNCSHLSKQEILGGILGLMEARHMF